MPPHWAVHQSPLSVLASRSSSPPFPGRLPSRRRSWLRLSSLCSRSPRPPVTGAGGALTPCCALAGNRKARRGFLTHDALRRPKPAKRRTVGGLSDAHGSVAVRSAYYVNRAVGALRPSGTMTPAMRKRATVVYSVLWMRIIAHVPPSPRFNRLPAHSGGVCASGSAPLTSIRTGWLRLPRHFPVNSPTQLGEPVPPWPRCVPR